MYYQKHYTLEENNLFFSSTYKDNSHTHTHTHPTKCFIVEPCQKVILKPFIFSGSQK